MSTTRCQVIRNALLVILATCCRKYVFWLVNTATLCDILATRCHFFTTRYRNRIWPFMACHRHRPKCVVSRCGNTLCAILSITCPATMLYFPLMISLLNQQNYLKAMFSFAFFFAHPPHKIWAIFNIAKWAIWGIILILCPGWTLIHFWADQIWTRDEYTYDMFLIHQYLIPFHAISNTFHTIIWFSIISHYLIHFWVY